VILSPGNGCARRLLAIVNCADHDNDGGGVAAMVAVGLFSWAYRGRERLLVGYISIRIARNSSVNVVLTW